MTAHNQTQQPYGCWIAWKNYVKVKVANIHEFVHAFSKKPQNKHIVGNVSKNEFSF